MLFLPIGNEQVKAPCGSIFTVDEVVHQVRAFLATVSDVSKPTCCPYCFAVLAFDLGNNAAALDVLQKHAYVFWKTCLRLIVQYTVDDIPRLRKRLRENQLACKDRSVYHKQRLPLGTPDTVDIFVSALLFAVGTALTEGKRPAYSNGRVAKFHNRKGYWPRHLDDLFPLDVPRVLDGILHWVCAPATAFPLPVLNSYLLIARAVVFPVLMEQPRHDRLVWALLQVMTAADQPTVHWNGAPPFAAPAGLCVPRMLLRDTMMCDIALFTLHIVRDDPHARTDDDAVLLAGHEALVLDALERLDLERPAAPNMRYSEEAVRRVLVMRVNTVGDYVCALRRMLGRPQHAYHHDHSPHDDPELSPALTLYTFLKRRIDATYCYNPECTRAELDDYGRTCAFQQCAQCRFARYCSVECQRWDWSRNEPKHKGLCASIAQLGRCMAESKAGADDFVARFDQTDEFTPEKVEMLIQWAAACRLLPRSWMPRAAG